MASKVRVYGESQKWTALGIIDAYIKMYPQATLDDLNKAFPRNLFTNNMNTAKTLERVDALKTAVAQTETKFDDKIVEYAESHNFFLTMPDGMRITFNNLMWTKDNFPKLVEQGKLYDVEVAEFTAAEKGIGKRGSYRLEYLNGYVPPEVKPQKSKWWIWLLLLLLVAAVLGFFLMRSLNRDPEVKVVKEVVHDTVFVQQIEEIEKNFNAAEFTQGKADLPEGAKFVLHDLAKVMEKNPQIRLRLEGHTSAEGDAKFNQKLSEDRAQAAVDFLIQHEGIDESRLEAVGLGSSKLKNTDDPKAQENRRTEFIVVE